MIREKDMKETKMVLQVKLRMATENAIQHKIKQRTLKPMFIRYAEIKDSRISMAMSNFKAQV